FGEAGVDLVGDTDNCVILNNLIHHCGNGLKLLSAQSSDNAIWNNQTYDRGLYLYSWRAFMTPLTTRNAAQGMPVETGRGISIVGNFVHGYFNSIVPQITGKPDALGANRDMDVLDNMVANNGDDGYDGGGVNMRMLDNRHPNTLEGVSAAPIERGPVYIIGNHGVARNYAFKLMNSVPGTGAAFLVHNSHLVVGGGAMRMPAEVQGGKPVAFDQKFIHNNLFVTTGNFIS
ncbi:MAG TPA: hypothetical protein VNI60_02630, partial [Pyrinomonadaceae bacterium]|nr:hypothetical protein [Pyrinomonadaceae bacterium]